MGLTVLDVGVVIAVLDANDAHHLVATEALGRAVGHGDDLVIPVTAYAECLVAPHRRGLDAVAIVDRFIDALPARVEPASRAIGAAAAILRAEHGAALRLPDALVLATAAALGADRILTTDAGWPKLTVTVEVLSGGR
jgi:predicted nucleic acid-binding protein